MEKKFGIYDLVAYIIPGTIILFSLAVTYFKYDQSLLSSPILKQHSTLIIFIFICSSYVVGQVSGSLVSKFTKNRKVEIIDILLKKVLGVKSDIASFFHSASDTENLETHNVESEEDESEKVDPPLLFVNIKNKQLHDDLIIKIEKILSSRLEREVSLSEYSGAMIPPDYQHLISRIVVPKILSTNNEFNRHLVNRSFCGNSVFAVLLCAFAMIVNGLFLLSLFALFVAILLFDRQVMIDKRIWKEIYRATLVFELSSDKSDE